MFFLKKFSLVVLIMVLGSVFVLSGCGSQETSQGTPDQPKQMTIGTASMGGAYYPIGTGVAELVSKYVDGIQMTAEVTGGAAENPRLVGNNEVDLGITNSHLSYFALNGMAPFDKKYNIRALGALHPTILHIVTLEGSDVKTIADMKGKRAAVGPAGGGTITMLKNVLSMYDMTLDDLQKSYVSYMDGMMALKDGKVDVSAAAAGFPTSAVLELSATEKIRFVELDENKLPAFFEKYPYYSRVVVPAETYKMEKDSTVIGVRNVLIVSADMDEETAYEITKAIFTHLEELGEYHVSAKKVSLQTAIEVPIELHPGAERFFKEEGLIK